MHGDRVRHVGHIVLYALIMQLGGCDASSPAMSPAEIGTIAKESQIYCNSVEVRGMLAEDFARLKSKPSCEVTDGKDGPAMRLSVSSRVSASDSNKLGVPPELTLSAISSNRPLEASDLQPVTNPPDHLSMQSLSSNGTVDVPIKRIGVGKESQYSTQETKIRELYAIPYLESVCVNAVRIPQGREPLWIVICRNVSWAFDEAKYEEVLQRIVQKDLPLIASAR